MTVEIPKRYRCERCSLIQPFPIVKPAPNPRDAAHGRCSNTKACEIRRKRAAKKAEAKP
jgi:hypothetical protein